MSILEVSEMNLTSSLWKIKLVFCFSAIYMKKKLVFGYSFGLILKFYFIYKKNHIIFSDLWVEKELPKKKKRLDNGGKIE